MQLSELTAYALELSHDDRLTLIAALAQSLQATTPPSERAEAVRAMRGFLATSELAPTDDDVRVMLDERRYEKYS